MNIYKRLVNTFIVSRQTLDIHVAESPDHMKMRTHVSHSYTSEKLQALSLEADYMEHFQPRG